MVNIGCIIPVQNIRNLHLPDEIIESVKKKEFHIYAVNTIDEQIYRQGRNKQMEHIQKVL